MNDKGELVDTEWTEEVLVYKLRSGVSEKDGKIPAERWAYLDPEIGYRISTWATGLTVEVCLSFLYGSDCWMLRKTLFLVPGVV